MRHSFLTATVKQGPGFRVRLGVQHGPHFVLADLVLTRRTFLLALCHMKADQDLMRFLKRRIDMQQEFASRLDPARGLRQPRQIQLFQHVRGDPGLNSLPLDQQPAVKLGIYPLKAAEKRPPPQFGRGFEILRRTALHEALDHRQVPGQLRRTDCQRARPGPDHIGPGRLQRDPDLTQCLPQGLDRLATLRIAPEQVRKLVALDRVTLRPQDKRQNSKSLTRFYNDLSTMRIKNLRHTQSPNGKRVLR
nr:hypothetical protein [Roseibium sp. RKSG952]